VPADPAGTPAPGVAAERTSLAWVRTALSLVAGVLVLARALQGRHPVAALLIGALGIAVAGLIAGRASARYRDGVSPPAPALLFAVTAAASAFALAAVLSVLIG
jgi:uncharacterized membrane protein YidH (DUF202 family)